MWLRDSSAQVVHYLPFTKEFLQIRHMIARTEFQETDALYYNRSAMQMHFNEEENGHCWEKGLILKV
ncbi:MAG: hypothetical protein ACLTRS_05660 [Lachnospiraceae bacterium]